MVHYKKLFLFFLLFCPALLSGRVIIFDIFGVLFEIPLYKKLSLMGTYPLGYTFLDRKNISAFSNFFLDILSQVPVDKSLVEKNTAMSGNKPMSDIMYAWQANKISYGQALVSICNYLKKLKTQKFFCSEREYQMAIRATFAAFDLETRKKLYKPLAAGIDLLKRCAAQKDSAGQRLHKLYVLSNMDSEMMNYLCVAYPDIFSVFDGIVISAEVGYLKPHATIYDYLIDKYKLEKQQCIFIDDQQENIQAAESLGITSILCNNFSTVVRKLEDMHVLIKKPVSSVKLITRVTCCIIAGYLCYTQLMDS